MPKETLGEFEHQVLLAILRLGGEAYSVPIVVELEQRTGREVAQAAVFIVLRRLIPLLLLIAGTSAGAGNLLWQWRGLKPLM